MNRMAVHNRWVRRIGRESRIQKPLELQVVCCYSPQREGNPV